ncbi:MAG: glycerate kinase [Opitutaceae bacterium]
MRALVAFDKFKDSLTAPEACAVAVEALQTAEPGWQVTTCPLTDGGDGFAAILTQAAGGKIHAATVTGPRGAAVSAQFGLVALNAIPAAARELLALPATIPANATVGLIEMATASGLALLKPDERDPWQTTSRGTGELIAYAAKLGAQVILLGVGGSATNDLGLGALGALGLRFIGGNHDEVATPVPATWSTITRIEGRVDAPVIRIACDVANPLLGPQGCSKIYGPQKGLAAADLPRMENLAAQLALQLCEHAAKSVDIMRAPGAGAAGGIAFGLMTAANAQLLPGADFVAAWLDLETKLAAADLVITGEGRFDESSLSGKGPGALALRALAANKPVHVFAGQIAPPAEPTPSLHLHAITPRDLPLPEALHQAARLLKNAVATTFTHR